MERTLIEELGQHVGETVSISGWVDVRRDHGKLVFLDIRDRSGRVQAVCLPNHIEALTTAQTLRPEWVVTIEGVVNERPEKMRVEGVNGNVELEAVAVIVISQAQELPFPKDEEVNIDTLFDNRPLTLRGQKCRDIFNLQATIVEEYRQSLRRQSFTEFQAPLRVVPQSSRLATTTRAHSSPPRLSSTSRSWSEPSSALLLSPRYSAPRRAQRPATSQSLHKWTSRWASSKTTPT